MASAAELKKAFNFSLGKIGQMSKADLKKYFPEQSSMGLRLGATREMAQLEFYNKLYNPVQRAVAMTGVQTIIETYIDVSGASLPPMLNLLNDVTGMQMSVIYSKDPVKEYWKNAGN